MARPERKRVFRKRSAADASGEVSAAPEGGIERPTGPLVAPTPPVEPGPQAILFKIPIASVEALLRHSAFRHRITSGLVFVQNKRPMADLLVGLAGEVFRPEVRPTWLRESECNLEDVVAGLSLKRPSRAVAPGVTVLHCDGFPTRVPGALLRVAAAPGQRRGLWVRGHVRDLHPAHLRLFDVMFLFDMSDEEVETLRSTVPLTKARVDELRRQVDGDRYPPEGVLVVTAGTDRVSGLRTPVIAGNPAVLYLRDEYGRPEAESHLLMDRL